jgi:hypothetical protein
LPTILSICSVAINIHSITDDLSGRGTSTAENTCIRSNVAASRVSCGYLASRYPAPVINGQVSQGVVGASAHSPADHLLQEPYQPYNSSQARPTLPRPISCLRSIVCFMSSTSSLSCSLSAHAGKDIIEVDDCLTSSESTEPSATFAPTLMHQVRAQFQSKPPLSGLLRS